MKRLLFFFTALMVLISAPAFADLSDPRAHEGEVSGYSDSSDYLGFTFGRPSTFMVGDSITYGGQQALKSKGIVAEVSSIPGRNNGTLPYYLEDRMLAPAPKRVIIALGTNASEYANQQYYEDAIAKLPDTTIVILVTTYRDPRIFDSTYDYRRQAVTQKYVSQWMTNIDSTRPHTCRVDWRGYVLSNQNYDKVLRDGVHLNALGYDKWSTFIDHVLDACV